MTAANGNLQFRPLRGGTMVYNPLCGEVGTLGFIAVGDDQCRWLVSCYHVLGRNDMSPCCDGEPITQPTGQPVACVRTDRIDIGLDVAAAEVLPGIDSTGEVYGLPPLGIPTAARIGQRVVKYGVGTGLTEGQVISVDAAGRLRIGPPSGAGPAGQYAVTAPGDSGALWVERATASPVAVNLGSQLADDAAVAVAVLDVLRSLRLTLAS